MTCAFKHIYKKFSSPPQSSSQLGVRLDIEEGRGTKPDTQSIPVVDGWAGAEMRVSPFLTHAHRRTDGRTDGRTDKGSYRVACPPLKTTKTKTLLPGNVERARERVSGASE